MPCLRHGVLIVFEGLDGAGKSTQATLLFHWLKEAGFDALLSKEPTGSIWGEKIRRVIAEGRCGVSPEEETEWFIRDRREHVDTFIRPNLDQRKIVILDRYYFSTIAYQGALGLDPEELERKNVAFAPVPDLAFLCDISPQKGLRRIAESRRGGADAFEREQYLTRVNELFASLDKPFLHRLQADNPVEALEVQVRAVVTQYLHGQALVINNDTCVEAGKGVDIR